MLLDYSNVFADPSEFSHQYLSELSRGVQLLNGAESILDQLQNKIGMLLMTNGIKEVQRSRLALSTIAHYFADVVISDEVGVAKPDPAIFEIAMERMGNPVI